MDTSNDIKVNQHHFLDGKRKVWVPNCDCEQMSFEDRLVYGLVLYVETQDWSADYTKLAQLGLLDRETVTNSVIKLRDLGLVNGMTPAPLTETTQKWFFIKDTAKPKDKLYFRLSSWCYYVRAPKGELSRSAIAIWNYLNHRLCNPKWKPRLGYFSVTYIAKCIGISRRTIERLSSKHKNLWKIDEGQISLNMDKAKASWFANCFTKFEKPVVVVKEADEVDMPEYECVDGLYRLVV